MNIKELREEVVKVLKEMNIPYELDTADVIKINDAHFYGVVFSREGVGKTIYVNDFAETDASATEIAEMILTACETSTDVPPLELIGDLKADQPISEISENLYVALVGDDRNSEFLNQVVSKSVGSGLSYIAQIRYAAGEGFMMTTVTKELAEANNWDIDEIFTRAIANSAEKDPAILFGMNDALFMGEKANLLESEEESAAEMMILSNRSGVYGAAAMFLPGVIEKVHDKIRESFFAIPSSVHEFIVIPESSGMTMPALNAMCREANQTVVRYNEILSDNVLYMPYNR